MTNIMNNNNKDKEELSAPPPKIGFQLVEGGRMDLLNPVGLIDLSNSPPSLINPALLERGLFTAGGSWMPLNVASSISSAPSMVPSLQSINQQVSAARHPVGHHPHLDPRHPTMHPQMNTHHITQQQQISLLYEPNPFESSFNQINTSHVSKAVNDARFSALTGGGSSESNTSKSDSQDGSLNANFGNDSTSMYDLYPNQSTSFAPPQVNSNSNRPPAMPMLQGKGYQPGLMIPPTGLTPPLELSQNMYKAIGNPHHIEQTDAMQYDKQPATYLQHIKPRLPTSSLGKMHVQLAAVEGYHNYHQHQVHGHHPYRTHPLQMHYPETDQEEKSPVEEVPKKLSLLERNRIAALKCRAKKKERIEQLKLQVAKTSEVNYLLKTEETRLREEIIHIKTLLAASSNCPVYRQFQKQPPEPPPPAT